MRSSLSSRQVRRRRGLTAALILTGVLGGAFLLSRPLQSQTTTAAQAAYQRGDLNTAEQILTAQLDSPAGRLDDDARVLRGLTRRRLGNLSGAQADFQAVLKRDPRYAEALYGLALVRRDQGQLHEAAQLVARAARLDDSNPEYRALQATLPAVYEPRPPRSRPAQLQVPFIAADGKLRRADGRVVDVKGVNMGVALPGKFPSEFPEEETFDTWMKQLGDLNANVLRVYTILPPGFYRALLRHNQQVTKVGRSPLYLIHGVWTELPENDDYRGAFQKQFTDEMDRVLGVVHGDVDLPERRGHAAGRYDADVSPYLLAYIIGREWEPYSVVNFDRLAAATTRYEGTYFRTTPDANLMEAWLARVMDHLAGEQARRYNSQTPVAFTNWPTLDPLTHVSEPTMTEETALRRARGEEADDPYKKQFNEDEIGLDARHIQATAQNRAGTFASFHAYPYYPDFMNNDPAYRAHPKSNYAAYLAQLKKHFGRLPVLISEIGVPSSRSVAHFQRQGRTHGNHSEAAQAAINVALDREIRAAGLAGTVLFAWLDEWFKRNWLYIDLERPSEHGVRWHNVMDAEENYGLLAAEPADELPLCSDDVTRLSPVSGLDGVRARATAEYLHLVFPTPASGASTLALDTHPATGNEFRLTLGETGGQLLINAGYRFFKPVKTGQQTYYLQDYDAVPTPGAAFVPYVTMPNMRRIGRDGTVYPAQTDEPGRLRFGPAEGQGWQTQQRDPTRDYCRAGPLTHLRLPWTLIGVTDPSERRVYDGKQTDDQRQVTSIGLTVNGQQTRFTWPTWQDPRYRLREKPVYAAFQQEWRAQEGTP